jgi:hypothetical protein
VPFVLVIVKVRIVDSCGRTAFRERRNKSSETNPSKTVKTIGPNPFGKPFAAAANRGV